VIYCEDTPTLRCGNIRHGVYPQFLYYVNCILLSAVHFLSCCSKLAETTFSVFENLFCTLKEIHPASLFIYIFKMASSVKFYKAPKIQSIFSKFPWLLASFTLITFLALGLSQSDLHGYTSLLSARVLMFYEGINGWLQSTLSEVDKFETMRNEYLAACPEQPFRPHLFTTDPLVIYLENYISLAETQYLIELA